MFDKPTKKNYKMRRTCNPFPHFFRGLQSGGVPSDGLPFCFSRYPFLPLVPPRRRKRQTMRRFSATKYNDIKTGGEFLKSAAAGLFSNGLYTKIRCRHSHSLTSSFPQLLFALFWANFRKFSLVLLRFSLYSLCSQPAWYCFGIKVWYQFSEKSAEKNFVILFQ